MDCLLRITSDPKRALRHSFTGDAVVVSYYDKNHRVVVPRWLAEACKFELDHENDRDPEEVVA